MFNPILEASLSTTETKIKRLGVHGKPQESFLYSVLTEFMHSEARKAMLLGDEYYRNNNEIKDTKRMFINRQGVLQEATALTNSKLPHAFMRKLTNQKVNYLLSKPMTLKTKNTKFLEQLNLVFNPDFFKRMKAVGRDAVVKGLSWIQVYYDPNGMLRFKRIPTEEIVPFWADIDRTILDAVMRYYDMTEYAADGSKKTVTKVEYYTLEGVWYYVKTDKGLKPDPEKGDGLQGHFSIIDAVHNEQGEAVLDENGQPVMAAQGVTWDAVPFVAFKYNYDELGLLNWIKGLVDDYDKNTSNTSNMLQDVPNNIKVVKNYDGRDKEEFVHNLSVFRMAFVSGDGGMDSIDASIDTSATDSHLTRLRRDIYEFGGGVDTQSEDLGTSSGVAIKFRYADLDGDAQDMASEFASGLDQLIWFVKVDLANKAVGDFMNETVEILFNTSMITDETATITNAKNSQGVISNRTIIANHPWVTDVDDEESTMEAEGIAEQDKEVEFLKKTDPTFGKFGSGEK